jgi:hypothetical protein
MNLTDVAPRDLQDFSKVPPAGVWLPASISGGEATAAKTSGNPVIKLQFTLTAEGFEGYTIYENGIVTSKGAKGAGFAVKKLLALGVDTSQEKDDQSIVDDLLGKEIFIKLRHEVMKDEDPPGSGKYTKVRLDDDGKPVKRATPQEYSLYNPDSQKAETKSEEKAPTKEAAPTKSKAPPAKDGASSKPVPDWMEKAQKK